MIVKLQTDATGTRLLAYNEDKSVWHEGECPEMLMTVMGVMGKRYCEGIVNENGVIEITSLLSPDHKEDW